MNFDVIITQFDYHNEISMILSKKYNAKLCVIITCPKEKNNYLPKVYEELLGTCGVRKEIIEVGDKEKIENLLKEFQNKNTLINLTGGKRINSLILLKEGSKLNINCTYVDILENKEFFFENEVIIKEGNFQDLNVEELIKLSGNDIKCDSNILCSKKDIISLSKIILKNLSLWEKNKGKLYDSNIFIHDYMDPLRIMVNKSMLKDEDKTLLNNVLKYLEGIKCINYIEGKEEIKIKFLNEYIKGFIFKSGTWLEVITKAAINEIQNIDDVKSGVEFLWGYEDGIVKNELDVVAIKDCRLVCISCKDSDKYDEDTLNELLVYSNRIGGKDVIKILVASKPPIKSSLILRAKEMEINIVVLKDSIEELENELINIIENKKK